MRIFRLVTLAAAGLLVAASPACSRAEGKIVTAKDPDAAAVAQGHVPGAGVRVEVSDKPQPLPAFALQDLDGKPIDQSAWKGKVVLLNFWATWCGPCRAEIPDLVALQAKYADHLIVVGLSVDEPEMKAAVKQYVADKQINYPVAMVDESVEKLFGGVSSIPTTFMVQTDGRLVQRHVGALNPVMTEQEVRVLAGLPTAAEVIKVEDTGQILKANRGLITEVPGLDLASLSEAQRALAIKRLNAEECTCGCGQTVAECITSDPSCETSPKLGKQIVADVKKRP